MLICIHILIGINAATGKADLPVTEQHCCRRLAKGFKARCTYSLGHASLIASASMHRLPGTVALWKVEEGQQSCVGSKSSQVCRQQRSHQLQCSASMHPLSCTIAVHEVEDAAGLCTAANPHRCMRSHQKWRPQLRPNWQQCCSQHAQAVGQCCYARDLGCSTAKGRGCSRVVWGKSFCRATGPNSLCMLAAALLPFGLS